MIVSEKGVWKKVFPIYGKSSGVALGISVAAAFAVESLGWKWLTLPVEPFAIVGTGLSILLVFRNNQAYSRYWEARTLWGQTIASLRSFCRLALTLSRPHASAEGPHPDEEIPPALEAMRREWVYRSLAFVHALRSSLRGESPSHVDFESLEPYVDSEELQTLRTQRNVPCALLHTQGERLADAWRADFIHPIHLKLLDEHLTALTLAYGGCEKIARTPFPPAYSFLSRGFVWVFVVLMPLALVGDLGWRTVFLAPLVAFLFGALQRFGEEIQHPFETTPDSLPLDSMTRQVEIELRQRLGEEVEELPEKMHPQDGVTL